MRKINRSFLIAWSIIAVLVFANVAVAATTVGTNITTTSSGTLTVDGLSIFTGGASVSKNFEVSGDFKLGVNAGETLDTSLEVGGTASISGATTLKGALTVTGLSVFTGGASSSKNFEVSGNFKLGVNAGETLDTSLEVGGTASISGLALFYGGASVSKGFEVSGNGKLGINAGTLTDTSLDVGGTASVSVLIVGTASTSCTNCVAQFGNGSNVVSTSVQFGGSPGGTTGTCLQMKNTAGRIVYCRVNMGQTVFTCNSVACY